MNNTEKDLFSALRLLKGCPLPVLLALKAAREMGLGCVGAEWLEEFTGYSDKTIARALLLLESYGQATRKSRYEWALASNEALSMLGLLGKADRKPGDPARGGVCSGSEPGTKPAASDKTQNIPTSVAPSSGKEGMENPSACKPIPHTGPGVVYADGYSPSRNFSKPDEIPVGGITPSRKFSEQNRVSVEKKSPGRKVSESETFRPSSSSRYLESRFLNLLLLPTRATNPENLRTGGILVAPKSGRAPPMRRHPGKKPPSGR
jgi:hypothetical protein